MKVLVFDKQENNTFSVEAVHFLRIYKAYPNRFEAKDQVGQKLLKEISMDEIDIGTTKAEEEEWKRKLEEASEQKRIDQLEKVVAEKVALITGKIQNKANETKTKSKAESEQPAPDGNFEVPAMPFSKKELDAMDMTQLVAIHSEIFPNKKQPKSKKEIIAEILQ